MCWVMGRFMKPGFKREICRSSSSLHNFICLAGMEKMGRITFAIEPGMPFLSAWTKVCLHTMSICRRCKCMGPCVGRWPLKVNRPDEFLTTTGWRRTDPDVISILDSVLLNYHADKNRVYLTGASMGGFGTWYYASKYPEKFAAILPVVGFPSVEQAEAVARAGIPVWVFSGGRDPAVQTEYFFAGMNRMNELGATMRFTTEQDMFHDVWNRVYAGEDVYNWLLQYKKR